MKNETLIMSQGPTYCGKQDQLTPVIPGRARVLLQAIGLEAAA